MGKKQLRINKKQILSAKEKLLNEKCTIVFENGSSLFILLVNFDKQYLYGKDMFTRKRKFLLSDIVEVIKEIETS